MDRGDGASAGQRTGVCVGAEAVGEEQIVFSTEDEKPNLAPGNIGLPMMRLCSLPGFWGKPNRPVYYYRCIGSDGYLRLNGPLCTNRPVRQDHLDAVVWEQIIGLLEDDRLIQSEIERRRELAQTTNPLRKREEGLRREQARLENHVERLVTGRQILRPFLRLQDSYNSSAGVADFRDFDCGHDAGAAPEAGVEEDREHAARGQIAPQPARSRNLLVIIRTTK